MCRWFAYVSDNEDCLLEDALITPAHGLTHQVSEHYLPKLIHHLPNGEDADEKENKARNLGYNIDGTGICWYTNAKADFGVATDDGLRPAMYKTTSPPENDINMKSICANTYTTALFAHVRASSGTPVQATNNHPFIFGRHAFMHNGTLNNFTTIRRAILDLLDPDAFSNVLGSTDSESLAALYMTYLTQGRGRASWEEEYSTTDMCAALRRAIATVIGAQKRILGDAGARPSSINIATTDGRRLVCFRYRNHKVQNPPSLYYSTSAGITLNRKYPGHPNKGADTPASNDPASTMVKSASAHGAHVIVASEPSTYKEEEWELIGKNCCLVYEPGKEVEVKAIEFEDGAGDLECEDPEFAVNSKKASWREVTLGRIGYRVF